MNELQLPGLAGRELLDVTYDGTHSAVYVAKMQSRKFRVTIRYEYGSTSNYAYIEILNAEMTWTRLVSEPSHEWWDAVAKADRYGRSASMARYSATASQIRDAVAAVQAEFDKIAARLFIRAERIMEA